MKFSSIIAATFVCAGVVAHGQVQQGFAGSNAPNSGSDFQFTIPPGVANFSVVVTNGSTTAYSWLLMTTNGVPTNADYTYGSRVTWTSSAPRNQISLEAPECVAGTHGLRVYTPSSGTHNFGVVLYTNRVDLRSATYPATKPVAFTTTGTLSSGQWHYFQVDVPATLPNGWRIALHTPSATTPNLYIRRDALPGTSSSNYLKAGTSSPNHNTLLLTSAEAIAGNYFIGVYVASSASPVPYTLSAEPGFTATTTLAWDPGTSDAGTVVHTNTSPAGGHYYFQLTTQATANQAWRTKLNVTSGSAKLYVRYNAVPTTSSFHHSSVRDNAPNGVIVAQGSSTGTYFGANQPWHILVVATPGAQWSLVTGEAYVHALPALAADGSSGATATIGAEGARIFSTTIPSGTLAWRLWVNDPAKMIYVRKEIFKFLN